MQKETTYIPFRKPSESSSNPPPLRRPPQADRVLAERDALEMELGNFKSLLSAREDRLNALERELEAFHRALDVQAQYEGGTRSSSGGAAGGREAMKGLYYELGKRQTDAHSLAISLAASNQELVAAKDGLRDAMEARAQCLSDLDALRAHCNKLTQQSVRDQDELAGSRDRYEHMRALSQRLQGQVEDLSQRLAEGRLVADRERQERDRQRADNEEALQRATAEAKSLRGRVEALQKSAQQGESMRGITEKRLAAEWAKVSAEMEAMADKVRVRVRYEGHS